MEKFKIPWNAVEMWLFGIVCIQTTKIALWEQSGLWIPVGTQLPYFDKWPMLLHLGLGCNKYPLPSWTTAGLSQNKENTCDKCAIGYSFSFLVTEQWQFHFFFIHRHHSHMMNSTSLYTVLCILPVYGLWRQAPFSFLGTCASTQPRLKSETSDSTWFFVSRILVVFPVVPTSWRCLMEKSSLYAYEHVINHVLFAYNFIFSNKIRGALKNNIFSH